jgi:hypothetical protein
MQNLCSRKMPQYAVSTVYECLIMLAELRLTSVSVMCMSLVERRVFR